MNEHAQYGVKILRRDVGPYVVLEFPFDSTKFSGWMTGEFRTEIDGEQVPGPTKAKLHIVA